MEHEYLIIEEQGKDIVVTGLKDNAPSDIVIPEGVTGIGDVGDDLLFIFGRGVFEGCKVLTSITIPDSVTEIGESAFADCTGLTSITIPDGMMEIGESAFRGCTGLKSIVIPNR